MAEVAPLLHEVSHSVFEKRRASPLPISLRNFQSEVIQLLSRHWYGQLGLAELKKFIEKIGKFRQLHTRVRPRQDVEYAHVDGRGLYFSPAPPEICHGLVHPMGNTDYCYLSGRFRFGAALFPGFHYDVQSRTGALKVTLYDCSQNSRDMRPENRGHINIFPNDHLLPLRA